MIDLNQVFSLQVNGLSLTSALFHTSPELMTVTGKNSLNQDIVVVTTVKNGAMLTSAGINFGSLTLQQMYTQGYLPASAYTGADLPNITFSNLQANGNEATRIVTITGTGPAGSVTLGVSTLPLTDTRIVLRYYVPESGATVNTAAFIEGKLQIGGNMPVVVYFPQGASDWQMASPESDSSPLTSVDDLNSVTGEDVETLLPAQLPLLPGFVLSSIFAGFNSSSGAIMTMGLTINNANPWTIISNDVLVLKRLRIVLNSTAALDGSGQITGTALTGQIAGLITVFGVDVGALIPIPALSKTWTIESSPYVELPGLGDLAAEAASLIGVVDFSKILPPGMDSLGALLVEYLRIEFTPTPETITLDLVRFRVSSADTWTLPYVSISLEDVVIDLTVVNPLADKSVVTGSLTGTLIVGSAFIPIAIEKPTEASDWTLRVTYEKIAVGLTDFVRLVGISAAQFQAAIPDNLSILYDLVLNRLDIQYNITQNRLSYIDYGLTLLDPWVLIPGYLSVDSFQMAMEIDFYVQPGDTTNITTLITAVVAIAQVPFILNAANNTPNAVWQLSAGLVEGEQLDLSILIQELLNVLLPVTFTLPASFPHVVVTTAMVKVTPSTGAFNAALVSQITWDIPFSSAQLLINDLNTTLDVGALPEGLTVRPYTFTASGQFSFIGIFGAALFTISNTTVDTIILVTLSNSAEAVKLPSVSNDLMTGTTTGSETWTTVLPHVPVGFSDFGVLTVNLSLNLTKNLFLLYGTSEKYGTIAYMMQQLPDSTWGYFVSVRLADGFTFASLLPALAVIDSIMTFQNGSACFAYSSYDVSSAQALTSSIPEFANAFTLGSGVNAAPVRPGVNFYAELNFGSVTRSVLFGNVVVLLSGVESKPDLVVYGYIGNQNINDPANTSLNALFRATLGDFVVLNLLEFHGVTFEFKMSQNTAVSLFGDMILTLYKGQPTEQAYTFHGDLTVDNTAANFSMVQGSEVVNPPIVNPLGMTGVTFNDLNLIFSYTFATSAVVLEIGGTVYYGTGDSLVTLSGIMALVNLTPVLVELNLSVTPELGIIAFVTQSVTNITYPSDYFDIFFISGSMYYYSASADTTRAYKQTTLPDGQAVTHADGFNIQANFSMFSRNFVIGLHAASNGITASGKMTDPFTLGFVTFTDMDFTGSPSLFLRVLTNDKAFGLRLGFILFEEHFATGEVSIVVQDQKTNIPQMRATFTYAGSIDMFTGSTISFTYDEPNGFRVSSWPFDFDALIEYEELMNGFKKPGCSTIVGMVFEKTVTTKFIVSPSFAMQGTSLVITLKGSYAISLFGSSTPFLVVEMPDLPIIISAPDSFSLSALPGLILDTITDSAEAIVESILNNPVKFTAFITAVGLVNAAPSLISTLICSGGKGAVETSAAEATAAAEAAEAAAAEAAEAATAAAASAAAETAAASAATAAAAAAGTGGGTVAAAAAAAAAIAAGAAAAIAAAFGFGSDGDPKPPDNPEAPELEKAHISNVVYENNRINVSWQSVRNAQAYRITLKKGSTETAYTNTESNKLTASFPVADLSAGTYSIVVAASASNYKGSVSNPSSIDMLGTVSIQMAYSNGLITASWNSITAPQGYLVQWFKDGGNVKSENVSSPGSSIPAQGQGSYTVRVQATGDRNHITGAWAEASNGITQLGTPANIHVIYNAATLSIDVSWDVVPNNGGYQVALLKDNTPFGAIETVNNTTKAFSINGLAPALYQARVMANAPDNTFIPGDWGTSSESVRILNAPVISSVVYGQGTVTVTIESAVTGADSYEAQFYGANNTGTGAIITSNTTVLNLADTLVLPGLYRVQARSVSSGNHAVTSSWTVSTQSITTLSKAAFSRVNYASNHLNLTWDAVVNATGYNIEIRSAAGLVVLTGQTRQTTQPDLPAATTLDLDVTALPKDVSYSVVIQAENGSGTGAWSDAVQTVLLDIPVITLVSYADNRINVTWNPVSGATGYNISIQNNSGQAVLTGETRATTQPDVPAPTTLLLDVTQLARGITYYAVIQSVAANVVSACSSASPVLLLDIPLNLSLQITGTALTASWNPVTGASFYNFQLLDSQKQPVPAMLLRVDQPASSVTASIQTLADGQYYGQVQSGDAANELTGWSPQAPVTITQLTPERAAQQLHDSGKTAQEAAPVLIGQFPAQLSNNPSYMITLLQTSFPESTKTITQIAWALAEAGYSNSAALAALNTAYPGQTNNVTAAIKAAYPAPSVMADVVTLQTGHATAQTAAPALRIGHSDLTALDMAVLLMMQFAESVAAPPAMAQAFLAALYTASSATGALTETYPLSSIADIAAAINAVYPLNPAAMASYLHGKNIAAQAAAPFINASFPTVYKSDAVGMINLLRASFPESTKTINQVAWALAEVPYTNTVATAALNTVYPGQITNISAAVKTAYPAPSVTQDVQTLQNQGKTALQAASVLHTAHQDLTALSMAVLLRMNFLLTTPTPTDMAQALKSAQYAAEDATGALYETYPLSSIADIAAAINSVYI